MRRAVVWFRRDLRLGDNWALDSALRGADQVLPLFVWDPELLSSAVASERRLDRLRGALVSLDADLRERGSGLVIRRGDPADIVPAVAGQAGASVVYATRDYTPRARHRDERVASAVDLRLVEGQLLHEPEALGETRIFTPFHRRWAQLPVPQPVPAPRRIPTIDGVGGEALPQAEPVGEAAAARTLRRFADHGAMGFAAARDRLDVAGTSRLSADLHLGTISVRSVFHAAADTAFRRQLAWRDWASHLIWFRPAARREAWQDRYRSIKWQADPAGADRWKHGMTGYPVVDAAMRQLACEGWISNRARLIVASFLTKDLLVDWRIGETHFLRELIDGDVANNWLGWQWTAGVGSDAAPYFRVMNPVLQGKRFDPRGEWVRRWVPELRDIPGAGVHEPWQAAGGPPRNYPEPIVDHGVARRRAIDWFSRYAAEAGAGTEREKS